MRIGAVFGYVLLNRELHEGCIGDEWSPVLDIGSRRHTKRDSKRTIYPAQPNHSALPQIPNSIFTPFGDFPTIDKQRVWKLEFGLVRRKFFHLS